MAAGAEHICFTVTGEFITNMSRTLWADEDQPEKALNLLRAAFPDMEEADRLCIVTGSKKLTGDSNVGCELESDNVIESQCGNPLTLDNMLRRFREREDESEDLLQLATGQTARMASPHGRVEVPLRRTRIETTECFRGVCVLKDDVDLEKIPYRKCGMSYKVQVHKAPEADKPSTRPTVALDSIPANATDGWLSPEGKFYQCGWQEHISLAFDLGETQNALEQKGWIKLSANEIFEPYRPPATQAQLNRIFDWCRATSRKFPKWLEEVV